MRVDTLDVQACLCMLVRVGVSGRVCVLVRVSVSGRVWVRVCTCGEQRKEREVQPQGRVGITVVCFRCTLRGFRANYITLQAPLTILTFAPKFR